MKRNEKGQVLVLVALAIFVLLGFAALGIDVGFMYSVRHELQRSADAGALSGASRFAQPNSEWSADENDPVMVEAKARAREFAAKDNVITTQLSPPAEVDVTFPSLYRIRVTTHRTAPLFFARIFGRDNQDISATAVAEAAVADRNVQCLKPWGIPIPWNDVDNNYRYDPPSSGGADTLWDLNDPNNQGKKMILKIGEPLRNGQSWNLPTIQQEAGHFFALAMCGDSGGNDYRTRIAAVCIPNCGIDINQSIPLEPGNMVGPTKQGVDDLIASDPGAEWAFPSGPLPANDNSWVTGSIGDGTPGNTDWKLSPRLVRIPLYNPENGLTPGRSDMKVAAFAAFWLNGYESGQGTVTAYFVDAQVLGSSSSGPAPGMALRILRLVE